MFTLKIKLKSKFLYKVFLCFIWVLFLTVAPLPACFFGVLCFVLISVCLLVCRHMIAFFSPFVFLVFGRSVISYVVVVKQVKCLMMVQ